MKDDVYTDIICKGFCKYYKEGKEDIHCNGYVFLRSNFTPYELKTMIAKRQELSVKRQADDAKLINLICKKCDFFVDGCDYIDSQSGNQSEQPCGGYLIIKELYN